MGKESNRKDLNLSEMADGLAAEESNDKESSSNADLHKMVNELHAHRVKLEIQNDEHRRALMELEESLSKYVDLYDSAPVGYFTLDEKSIILDVNLTGAGILREARNNLVNQSFSLYIADESQNLFYSYRKKLHETADRQTCNLKMLRRDNTNLYARLEGFGVLGSFGDPSHFKLAVIDIAQQDQAGESLSANVAYLSKMYRYEMITSEIIRSIHKSINLKEVLENAVDAMIKNIEDVDNVLISVVEGKEAVLKAYRGYPTWFIERVRRISDSEGVTWKTIMEGKPIYVENVDKETAIDPEDKKVGTKSYLAMPIRSEGKTIGVIRINSLKKSAFDSEELKLLDIVARQIEIAMNNALLAEELQKANEELERGVEQRTRELSKANEELQKEIAWSNWAAKALRDSEQRYRALYEENPSMCFTLDREGKILSANLYAAEKLGFLAHEFLGHSTFNTIYDDDKKKVQEKLEECFRNPGEILQWELRRVRKDGSMFWVRDSARAIQNTDGNSFVLVISDDITDRKKMEETIHRHMEILDLATDTIIIRDLDYAILYWNQGAEWTYGWTKEEAIGKSTLELLRTEFPRPLEEIKEELLREEYWEGEIVRTKRDGARIVLSSRWTLQWGTEKNPVGVLEISNDITERKHTEEILNQQKDMYEAMINAQSDVGECFIVIENSRILYANEYCEKISGYSKSEMTTMPSFLDIIAPEQRDLISNQLQKSLFGQKLSGRFELCILNKKGEQVILDIAVNTIKVRESTQLIVIGRDVTERKRVEKALQKSEERLRIALEGASLGNWDWNIKDGNLEWSEKCKTMFGLAPDTVMSYDIFLSAVHPDDRVRTERAVMDALEDVRDYAIDYRTLWPDGTIRWIHAKGLVIHDLHGKPDRMLGIAMDITERKRAEEEINTSLKEKETLLSEIHHRVKNNLQILSSLLNLQSRRIKDKDILQELNEYQNRIKSMALIHEKLYESGNLGGIDFLSYAKSLSKHLLHSHGANSSIKVKIKADKVLLGIDKSVPCGLIINEIVSNSLKHAFGGRKEGEIQVALYQNNNAKSRHKGLSYTLVISDDGIGFPKELDFRNTESLGLQLVCALTKQMDGDMKLDTSSGTEFRLTFSP